MKYSISIQDETGKEVYRLDHLSAILGSAYIKEEHKVLNFCNSDTTPQELLKTSKEMYEFAEHVGKTAMLAFLKSLTKDQDENKEND